MTCGSSNDGEGADAAVPDRWPRRPGVHGRPVHRPTTAPRGRHRSGSGLGCSATHRHLRRDAYQVEFGKVGTPGVVLEDLEAGLTTIEELTRPVDAIKHQAKTVTVGISRSDESLLQVVAGSTLVIQAGSPRDRPSRTPRLPSGEPDRRWARSSAPPATPSSTRRPGRGPAGGADRRGSATGPSVTGRPGSGCGHRRPWSPASGADGGGAS